MQTKPKILVIRGGALGDVIMTTPIIRELYQDYDGYCEIYVQTMNLDVFKNNPYVTKAAPAPRGGHYDAVYDLRFSYENNPKVHSVKAYAWSVFGNMELSDYSLELFPTEADSKKVKNLGYENYIVLHMRQHDWPSRNLRPSFFQELINRILAETKLNIVQVGGKHELSFGGNPRLIDNLGAYSIHELHCLIDSAQAFIGVDGGLIHVAACTDTPLLAFFTSCKAKYREPLKEDAKFYPFEANIDCYGCQEDNPPGQTSFSCRKDTVPCIDTFSVEHVVDTLKKVIR